MVRKRRVGHTSLRYDPADFMNSDGWSYYMFDATPLLDSLREAQAAWEACRVACWDRWLEWHGSGCWPMLPPHGAQAHDDLTDRAFYIRRENTITEALEAVAADLEAVEDFRKRRPDAAKTIPEALKVLEDDLTTYRSLIESYGDDYDARESTLYKLRGRVRS